MSNLNPIEQKVSIVAKDLDTAFQVYGRYVTRLTSLRGWTVTILLAYMGFLITNKTDKVIALLPLGLVLLLFMYLEAIYRRELRFLAKEVRKVQEIFMEDDPAKFADLIKEYKFRDLRAHAVRETQMNRIIKTLKFMLLPQIIGWYFLLLLLAVACYLEIKYHVFQ